MPLPRPTIFCDFPKAPQPPANGTETVTFRDGELSKHREQTGKQCDFHRSKTATEITAARCSAIASNVALRDVLPREIANAGLSFAALYDRLRHHRGKNCAGRQHGQIVGPTAGLP